VVAGKGPPVPTGQSCTSLCAGSSLQCTGPTGRELQQFLLTARRTFVSVTCRINNVHTYDETDTHTSSGTNAVQGTSTNQRKYRYMPLDNGTRTYFDLILLPYLPGKHRRRPQMYVRRSDGACEP